MQRINQNGRSMIEMLGVLAIISVLSVGGIAGFSKAIEKYRVNKTIQQVTYIAGNIKTLFGSQKDYRELATIDAVGNYGPLIKAGVIPEEMYTKGRHALLNPFGGTAWMSSKIHYKKTFDISYFGVPKSSCIDLMTADWEIEGLVAISSNDINYDIGCEGNDHIACAGGSVTPIPMPVGKAIKACDRTSNTLMWEFY